MVKFEIITGGHITVSTNDFAENGIVTFYDVNQYVEDGIKNSVAKTGGIPAIDITYDGWVGIPEDIEFALNGLGVPFKLSGSFTKSKTQVEPGNIY